MLPTFPCHVHVASYLIPYDVFDKVLEFEGMAPYDVLDEVLALGDHEGLHVLVVLIDRSDALFELLQLLEYITCVMWWHKLSMQHFLHVIPSFNWPLFTHFMSCLNFLLAKKCIILKLKGGHGYHLLLRVVVHS